MSRHTRSVGFPVHHPPVKTFPGVPIGRGDETLGNLYLTQKPEGEEFTPEEEVLLLLFAAQAAVAIRNARLHRQLEMERRRPDAILNDAPDGMAYNEKATG